MQLEMRILKGKTVLSIQYIYWVQIFWRLRLFTDLQLGFLTKVWIFLLFASI